MIGRARPGPPPGRAAVVGRKHHRGYYVRPRERFTVRAGGRQVAVVDVLTDAYRLRREYAALGFDAEVVRVEVAP